METKKQVLSFAEFIYENYSHITEQQKEDIENLIVQWWKDHEDLTVSRKSLSYWEGGEDKQAPNVYHNRVVSRLESLIKSGKEKTVLPKIVEELKKLSDNGVYITFAGFETNRVLDALKNKSDHDDKIVSIKIWDNPSLKE